MLFSLSEPKSKFTYLVTLDLSEFHQLSRAKVTCPFIVLFLVSTIKSLESIWTGYVESFCLTFTKSASKVALVSSFAE